MLKLIDELLITHEAKDELLDDLLEMFWQQEKHKDKKLAEVSKMIDEQIQRSSNVLREKKKIEFSKNEQQVCLIKVLF